MTKDASDGSGILGSLRSSDGRGVVHLEGRFNLACWALSATQMKPSVVLVGCLADDNTESAVEFLQIKQMPVTLMPASAPKITLQIGKATLQRRLIDLAQPRASSMSPVIQVCLWPTPVSDCHAIDTVPRNWQRDNRRAFDTVHHLSNRRCSASVQCVDFRKVVHEQPDGAEDLMVEGQHHPAGSYPLQFLEPNRPVLPVMNRQNRHDDIKRVAPERQRLSHPVNDWRA
jgi:hypothetical protein